MLHYKVGFLGCGNLAQAIIKGLVEKKVLNPSNIYATNRSPGKPQKMQELYGIKALATNEELVDTCDIVILATKPQDLSLAIDSISSSFSEKQIVISLAAGTTLRTLQKKLRQVRLARVMVNTPSLINRGVVGYVMNEDQNSLESVIEDLFSSLGYCLKVADEDQLEAVTVSCASGTGFIFELMTYWQDWIEERGFDPVTARKMVVETFVGTALLAANSKDQPIEELLNKVASKKGTTAAGLESMRELEVERLLRYSFEKAALRNQDLAKQD
jgi:pyrroline-5-carboxylate reductase